MTHTLKKCYNIHQREIQCIWWIMKCLCTVYFDYWILDNNVWIMWGVIYITSSTRCPCSGCCRCCFWLCCCRCCCYGCCSSRYFCWIYCIFSNKVIRCWVAAHMCVLSHFCTCDVRTEVRAESVCELCVRCRCVRAYFDLRCAIALSWLIRGQTNM